MRIISDTFVVFEDYLLRLQIKNGASFLALHCLRMWMLFVASPDLPVFGLAVELPLLNVVVEILVDVLDFRSFLLAWNYSEIDSNFLLIEKPLHLEKIFIHKHVIFIDASDVRMFGDVVQAVLQRLHSCNVRNVEFLLFANL